MKRYIFFVLLVAVVFANSLTNSFINGDDYAIVVDNPKIDMPLSELPMLFTVPFWKFAASQPVVQVYYRPVLALYHVLIYKVWGPNPLGFHVANIILHLACVIILYRCAMLFFNEAEMPSLMAASLFAVHPANSQAIVWISSTEVMFGFFIILTLYFFLKERTRRSLLVFAFALLSKETAVMLPLALPFFSIPQKGFKKGTAALIPYIALVGVYFVVRGMIVDSFFGEEAHQPIYTRILTMAVATFDYARLLSVPYPLKLFYPARWHSSVLDPKVLGAITMLLAASLFVFRLRNDKSLLFQAAFLFIMLAPAIWKVNAFPVWPDWEYISERYLYVPSMAFSLIVAIGVTRIAGGRANKHLVAGWFLLVAVFSGMTMSANKTWENSFTFYGKIINDSPNIAFAHNNLGNAYFERGRLDEAMVEYKAALKIKDYADAHRNLGLVYWTQVKVDETIEEFEAALRLAPGNANDIYLLRVARSLKEMIAAQNLEP